MRTHIYLSLIALGIQVAAAAQTTSALEARLGPAAIEARQTHASVDILTLGTAEHRIYVFLPAEPALSGRVPIVFFHHGWQGMNPLNYGALIDHLTREGNVVLFPVYQASNETPPQTVIANAAESERAALNALAARGLTPDPQRVVYFGYSMGVPISLRLAVTAESEHLPLPQALVLAAPGDARDVATGPNARSILPVLTTLPRTLPIAIVTGEDDHAIGMPNTHTLAPQLCRIDPDRRVVLILPGDQHDGKKVAAGHGSPGAPDTRYNIPLETPITSVPTHIPTRTGFEVSASLNQLDFYGYWKVLDALIDSLATAPSSTPVYVPPSVVFNPKDPGQLYLGLWPDGTPYPSAHTENPCHSHR